MVVRMWNAFRCPRRWSSGEIIELYVHLRLRLPGGSLLYIYQVESCMIFAFY